MTIPRKVGLKHVVQALVAYGIVTLVLPRFMEISTGVDVGVVSAVMAVSILQASNEAFTAGRNARDTPQVRSTHER